MAEYTGSIELISGIKPKNNGDFPLVNAKDVLMPDGTRLDKWPGGGGGSGGEGVPEVYHISCETFDEVNGVALDYAVWEGAKNAFLAGNVVMLSIPTTEQVLGGKITNRLYCVGFSPDGYWPLPIPTLRFCHVDHETIKVVDICDTGDQALCRLLASVKLGDIESALDSIIEIQNSLIGGEQV